MVVEDLRHLDLGVPAQLFELPLLEDATSWPLLPFHDHSVKVATKGNIVDNTIGA
jgi:hypothetical protein